MAYLFDVNNTTVQPTTEILLVEPYKSIWERDKTKKKSRALTEFAYIEFMSSMKKSNPFRQYPEEDKHNVISKELFKDENWQPDELIIQGIDKIKKFQEEASVTYTYYLSAKTAAESMKKFFNTVNPTVKNHKTGNPLYKPKDITSALKDTEDVIKRLQSVEKKLQEELTEELKNKSDKQVSFFAEPESFKS